MKKKTYLSLMILAMIGIGLIGFRFLTGPEDAWLCVNGGWVKHGQPAADKPPATGCGDEANQPDNGQAGDGQFNWSIMDQGPYRDHISFATSDDLLTWQDDGRILVEHASVPGAVIKDGVIFAYYVDVSTDGVAEQLGLITSPDSGRTWTPPRILTVDGLGDRAIADPAPVLLADGRIRLYYFDINGPRHPTAADQPNEIYSAIAVDGVNFTQEDGIRYRAGNAFDPDVEKQGAVWRMYLGDIEGHSVLTATSVDGLTFAAEGTAFSGGAVPDVIQRDDVYYLFTAGINIATSTDGRVFSPTTGNFHGGTGGVTADPSVVQLPDGTYLMMYKSKLVN